MSNKKEILCELDLHGVIADIYSLIEENIIAEGYENFTFENVKTYEANNSGIGCPKVVIDKYFRDKNSYLFCKPYEGALEFVTWLQSFENVKVKIHSLAETFEIKQAIESWCYKYMPNVDLQVDVGIAKVMLQSDICIEDCLENLNRSVAPIKYIVARHHNKQENNTKWDGVFDESLVVNDFMEIQYDLKDILSDYFKEV